MLKKPEDRLPPQTLCSCLVPEPYEFVAKSGETKVYCRKCGYMISPTVTKVIQD